MKRLKDTRPIEDREFLYTNVEIIAYLEITERQFYKWKCERLRPPKPPTTKAAVIGWCQRAGVPPLLHRRRGPTRLKILELDGQNIPRAEIARRLGISRASLYRHLALEKTRRRKEAKYGLT